MAESTEASKNTIQLDEESEGNSIGSGDFIFRKIGSSVPLKPSDSSFEFENAPKQALAISERFRVIFLAHSKGFYVSKTKDVIELAKEIKQKGKGSGSIQELSIVDVSIGRVSILALSTDSSTLAACVGGHVHLFSVVSLLNKEKEPSFSCSIDDSSHVKDLRWRKNEENSYVVLSSHGKLYHGYSEGPLKDVMDNVDAVDWSVKGDYLAVARENTLRILSFDFKEHFNMFLMFQPWANDSGCITKVDSIKWVRCDSIIIGCIQLTEDGIEEGYLVQAITNIKDEIIEASSKPMVISFGELFASLNDAVVPFGGGPYLLMSYLERWELVLASNRKNTDQHIVSLGWSLDDNHREVAAIEFRQDKEVPRIELPENGDDNLIVGFGVDKVSLYEKVEFMKSDQEYKELSPYCVLLCLTSDGKLIMFHAARISDPSVLPSVHTPPGAIPSVEGDSSAVVSQEPTVEDSGVEKTVLYDKSKPMSEEAFDINRDDGFLKENCSHVTVLGESLNFQTVAGQTSGIETSKSIVASDSDYKSCNSLQVASNKEPKFVGTIQKSEVDAESHSSPIGQGKDSSGTNFGLSGQQSSRLKLPFIQNFGSTFSDATETDSQKLSLTTSVVLDDKSRPMGEKAFDINRGDGILKENTSQVSELNESLKFPFVAGQTFGIETKASIVTSDSGYKSRDSLLVPANKEPKSLGAIQKSEADAASNSFPIGQVDHSSGAKLGLSSQQSSKLEQLPGNQPLTQGFGSAFRDVSKTEGQKLMSPPTVVGLNAGSSVSSSLSDTSATRQQSFQDSLKGNEAGKGLTEIMGSSNFQAFSSGSRSSGKQSMSNDFNAMVSSFASSGSIHGDGQENTGIATGKTTCIPASQSSPSTFQSSSRNFSSKDPIASPSPLVFSSGKPIQEEGQKTAITGTRTFDSVSSQRSPSLSQEDSMLGKSLISKGTHLEKNSRTRRLPGMLDSELRLSKSFCNFSETVKELDTLISDIEGKGGFWDACTVLQKSSVLELEEGLENLSERCRVWKNTMKERLGDIQHLLDKTMQVLARKIYVEGIVKQVSNTQYWDLWNRQKLSPEFELKRHQILKINQNLMNQIIELERHFNALELNKFGDRGRLPMGQRAFHSSSEPPRQTQSLHSLYNTMNSQLAAAEQLSECLSKQMAVLNIESPPVKKQNVSKELFESIGLTYDGDNFQSPNVKRADRTPDTIKKPPLSSFCAIKEHSRRNASSSLKGIEPETARRRRDSLDRSLARFEPQKTTVKRLVLEEHSRVNANMSSFRKGKEIFSSPMGEGFSVAQTDRPAPSFSSLPPTSNKVHLSTYPSNKDIQRKSLTEASISPSVSLFKWAEDKVGASQPGGSLSPFMQQRVNIPPLPTEVVASPLSVLNTQENIGSSESSSTVATYVARSSPSTVQNISTYETIYNVQSETPPNQTSVRISTTTLPTKPASPRKTVHIKTQATEFSNLKSGETVQTKQMTRSMNPGAGTMESSFTIPQKVQASPFVFQMDTSNRVQSGETAASISSSPAYFAPQVPSSTSSSSLPISASSKSSLSSIPASVAVSSSESSPLAIPFGGSVPSKGVEKTVPPASLSVSSSFLPSSAPFSFQIQNQQVSPPISSPTENVMSLQPDVIVDELSLKTGPAQSPTPASEISARSSYGSQSSSHTTTTSSPSIFGVASNASLNSQPEAPSAARVLFTAPPAITTQGKTEALDTTVTEEDEMEEEASDTTELSLVALGGFGLGSTPAPSAPKPNPFGGSFGAAAASPPSSLTVPSGELFRPAFFSFSSATPSQPTQPTSHGGFSGFGTGPGSGFGHPAQIGAGQPALGSGLGGFGQSRQLGAGLPSQIGAGQQALGSVLGGFGQSRQLGPGLPGVGFASSSGISGGGFSAAAVSGGFGSGAGFAGASTGGGFAGVASAGGGFAAAASAGGGFAGAYSSTATGGFGAFSNRPTSGGISSFGGSSNMGSGKPPELFTQMRR